MSLLFGFEIINENNLATAIIEIAVAGTAAYFLAKYFFRKELNIKTRELQIKKDKIENDFTYYFRKCYFEIWMLSSKKKIIKRDLERIQSSIHGVIECHKVFDPTNMKERGILEHNNKLLVDRLKTETLEIATIKEDLKIIMINFGRVGLAYNIQLIIA